MYRTDTWNVNNIIYHVILWTNLTKDVNLEFCYFKNHCATTKNSSFGMGNEVLPSLYRLYNMIIQYV